jgi:phosphate-selective porin
MKKVYLIILVLSCFAINAKAQSVEDTLREQITEMKDRINGIDERLMTSESDLSKLTKIKFSGYIQAQFDRFENRAVQPNNYFSLRRVRLKATYEAADGIKFVVQPDFSPSGVTLKDAYVVLNDHFIKSGFFKKTFSLTMGKFNRLNYEVEYSSSQRELPERSTIIRTIYPGERAIGFKLEANPESIPLKVQLALFNGNDGGFNQFSDTTGKTASVMLILI